MHWLADPRLAAAIAHFLEAERVEATAVIEHLGVISPLKPTQPA